MRRKIEILEIRRQSAHLLYGFILAVSLYLKIIDPYFLLGVLFIAFGLSLFSCRSSIPVFCKFLHVFERKKDLKKLPGKGLLFFTLGATLTTILFPLNIAVASILILSFGDSVSHIFGRHFGRTKTPFHDKKYIEGSIFGILVSALAASFFVPSWSALLASTVAMILEFPEIKIKGILIDDNIIVPLGAGLTMYLLV